MRRLPLVAVIATVGLLLTACKPGFPDPSYGAGGTAPLPEGALLAMFADDGSVVAMTSSFPEPTTVVRLDLTGRLDPRWRTQFGTDEAGGSSPLPALALPLAPARDGGFFVQTLEIVDVEFATRIERIGPDGLLVAAGAPVRLADAIVASAVDLGSSVRVVLAEGLDVQAGAFTAFTLVVADIDWTTGSVSRHEFDTTDSVSPELLLNVDIASDGSLTMVDQAMSAPGANDQIRVRRFDAAFAPVATFGAGGVVAFDHQCADGSRGWAGAPLGLTSAGTVLALRCGEGSNGVEFVRLRADGTVDAGWSTGTVTTAELVAGTTAVAVSVLTPQPDGTTLAVVTSCQAEPEDSCAGNPSWLVRLRVDGTLDPDFGIAGAAPLSIDDVTDIRATPAGIYMLGTRHVGDDDVEVVARVAGPVVAASHLGDPG